MTVQSGVACNYRSVVAAGDKNQDIRVSSEKEYKDGTPLLKAAQVMRHQCVMARALRNTWIQTIANRETSRFGEPMLSEIKKLFPWTQDVKTKAEHNTEFYPVFFARSKNLCVPEQERRYKNLCAPEQERRYIRREAFTFVSTLVMLALECVVNRRIGKRSILVICYLTCVVEDLKVFLAKHLETICQYWHQTLFPEEEMVSYSMDALKKTVSLTIQGPFEVKGKTAHIVFLLSLLRKEEDDEYRGLMAEMQLLGMHYTRARLRMYAFLHDLLPTNSEPKKNFFGKRDRIENDTETTRKKRKTQECYENLKWICVDSWVRHTSYNYRIGHIRQSAYNLLDSIEKEFPFLHSDSYRDVLRQDLSVTNANVGERFQDKTWWIWTFRSALHCYEDMQRRNWWPTTNAAKEKATNQKSLDDINWWRGLLESDAQCQTTMIIDKRRQEDIAEMRTELQLEEDGDGDKGLRPEDLQVFQIWRSVMLNCSTVTLGAQQQCPICLSFTKLQQEWVFSTVNSIAKGVLNPESGDWLARALAQRTEIEFRGSGVLLSLVTRTFA